MVAFESPLACRATPGTLAPDKDGIAPMTQTVLARPSGKRAILLHRSGPLGRLARAPSSPRHISPLWGGIGGRGGRWTQAVDSAAGSDRDRVPRRPALASPETAQGDSGVSADDLLHIRDSIATLATWAARPPLPRLSGNGDAVPLAEKARWETFNRLDGA
jgi:hypothetical protein